MKSSQRSRLAAWTLLFTLPWLGCAGLLPPAEHSPRSDLLAFDDAALEPDSAAALPPATTDPGMEAQHPQSPSPSATDVPPGEPSNVVAAPAADTGPWIPQAAEGADPSPAPESLRDRHARARTITFWTGIGALSVGAAGLVAFGVTGRITQEQIRRVYEDDVTRARTEQLQRRGDIMNGLAIGSAVLAVIGLGMSTIAYALDHSHCGPLSQRRWRKECRR